MTNFERASVYEGVQIGVETTPGTAVACNKRLLGLQFDLENMTDIKTYRPQGNKFITTSQQGKEMTSGRIEGILCFNDLVYLASCWLTTTTPTVPTNNSTWVVSATTTNTVGFTFKGSVLAAAAYTTAALFQTAIAGMASVGAGNVLVTGTPSTGWVIQFIGALSTDTSAITSVTGTASATITLQAAATLTNRWKFVMAPTGPDSVTTLTVQKGAAGVSNQAQQAAFAFIGGMQVKLAKSEASFTGDMAAQTTLDPVTMTSSPTDITCVPVDPRAINIWMGPASTSVTQLLRCLEFEFGVMNRANGLMTLNANDTSFSNRIELAPNLTSRMFLEHDAQGQAALASLRAGTQQITVIEALGPLIETGFPYRMKWTICQKLIKPNTADVDGVYGRNYDTELQYNSALGTAIQLEIDCPLTAL